MTGAEAGDAGRSGHRAVRIGLTGPIGCGKSTVAGWLGERPGVVVVDADRVARDVLDRGEPALDAVIARFGVGLLRDDGALDRGALDRGALDRGALGRIVFADPAALRDLEAIVHPAVRPRILAALAEADRGGADAIVIEAIKLVEGGLAAVCDETWLVTCGPAIQMARLIARGMSQDDATPRIAAQGDMVGRMAPTATRIFDTSGAAGETRLAVESALDAALASPRAS